MTQFITPVFQAEIEWLKLGEFAEVAGLSSVQIEELVELGILSPDGASAGDWRFSQEAMVVARRLRRLREDLDLQLDLPALALGFQLLERIRELEYQLGRTRTGRWSE